ncbi:right-handed parallel beta-helix repeat-containing protein [Saccharibacillus sp. JS10]|uniref:right-handed parallel beta-helix repeat-containing protein n=1 Tax=Saccharibacillus sp. JS10 TaxID=2950552 RepID=UPI00210BBD4F|nr:right-handed parallel beta-helix repeat-containing protein [Saccharibacillus sp. JS10]MCQ4087680.1 right-handed parallel beta-helix repeat-containing protein [Saccharibacillus sp. JS10]
MSNVLKSFGLLTALTLSASVLPACVSPMQARDTSLSASHTKLAAFNASASSKSQALAPAASAGTSASAAAQADAQPYYYVAPSGSDQAGTGSEASPWQTVQRAVDAAMKTGGTVYLRGGIYNQSLKLTGAPGAANSAAHLTVASYPSETAVLDGTDLPVALTGALIELSDVSRVTVRGLEVRNYKTAKSGSVPIGIYVHGAGEAVSLLDNKVHDIGNTSTPKGSDLSGRDAHGIAVYGTKSPASIRDLTISGNEVYNLTLGSSEALVLNGNVEKFTIENNHVHDNDNIGIDAIGFEGTSPDSKYDQARNGTITGNVVTGNTAVRNPSYGMPVPNEAYSAGGIYVDGGRDIVIERNRSENNDIGIEIASEHRGRSTSGITVRSNLVVRNAMTGIAIGGYDKKRGSTTNSIITGNTVAYNDTLEWGTGQLYIQFDTQDNIVQNNIFVASGSNTLIRNDYTENTRNKVDYNLYFAPDNKKGSWVWKKKNYSSFDAYRKGSANDANSLFVDPQFVDAKQGNYRLKSGSPAVASGVVDAVLNAANDFDGKPRGQSANGLPSRGAYE